MRHFVLRGFEVDVAREHQHDVGSPVVGVEPFVHVCNGSVIQVLHRADDGVAVRVIHRVQPIADTVAHLRIGPILTLPFLVLDHAALLVQRFLRHRAEQVTHAVAFHPQRHVECTGRHGRIVVGAILGGRTVHPRGTRVHERGEVLALAILGALEHQVFEQVRETRFAVRFVFRTDAIPHTDKHGRRGPVLVYDHGEAVIQPEHVVGNIDLGRDLVGGGIRGRGQRD